MISASLNSLQWIEQGWCQTSFCSLSLQTKAVPPSVLGLDAGKQVVCTITECSPPNMDVPCRNQEFREGCFVPHPKMTTIPQRIEEPLPAAAIWHSHVQLSHELVGRKSTLQILGRNKPKIGEHDPKYPTRSKNPARVVESYPDVRPWEMFQNMR